MPYLADKGSSLCLPNMAYSSGDKVAKKRVCRSKAFKSWYKSLTDKEQGIVDTRIDSYRELETLINYKLLDSNFCLYEFKWDSGMRVYFSLIQDAEGKLMLILVGGNKNSQANDITEAKNIVRKAVTKINEKKVVRTTTKKVAKK